MSANARYVGELRSVNPDDILVTEGKPENMLMGLVGFEIELENPSVSTAEVVIRSSVAASPGSGWFMFNETTQAWTQFPESNVVFSEGGTKITLTLEDGGVGDADGIVNGRIVDPSGFGTVDAGDDGDDDAGSENCRIHVIFQASPITIEAMENGSAAIVLNADGSRTITVTPDFGYEVESMMIDGVAGTCQPDGLNFVCTVPADGDAPHTIVATFVEGTLQYKITASAGPNGSISPSGEVAVKQGDNQAFTMQPFTGYKVADVKVDGASIGATYYRAFSNVTEDHTISVSFEPVVDVQYEITASSGANGSISPSGPVFVYEGGRQTFTMTPAGAWYEVADVLVDGVSVGAVTTYEFTNVVAARTIHVTFKSKCEIIPETDNDAGTIRIEGMTATILAYNGYVILDVLVNDVSVGAVPTYTFLVPDSADDAVAGADEDWWPIVDPGDGSDPVCTYEIRAIFEHTGIVADSGDNGIITLTANADGIGRTAWMIPDEGYEVDDVLVDDVSVGPVSSYEFAGDTGLIYVTFKPAGVQYIITATYGSNGTITPAGAVRVNAGVDQTFIMQPDSGYVVDDVKVDGVSYGALSDFTFPIVDAAHNIHVTFKSGVQYTITATVGNNGSITPGKIVILDDGLTALVLSDSGYEVDVVTVNGVPVGSMADYTFPAECGDSGRSARADDDSWWPEVGGEDDDVAATTDVVDTTDAGDDTTDVVDTTDAGDDTADVVVLIPRMLVTTRLMLLIPRMLVTTRIQKRAIAGSVQPLGNP